MKRFRVYDTVNNVYLAPSENLFICATGKIYQRLKDCSLVEVTDCVVEWESAISAETGYAIYEGDVIEAVYINDTHEVVVIQKGDVGKIIYADGTPPFSDQKKIRKIHMKGNIHFDEEYKFFEGEV